MGKTVDLTGRKIGKLLITERKRENKRTRYKYVCDCGNTGWIRSDNLKKTRSCGCLQKETQFKPVNLVGKRFSRVVAIRATNKRDRFNGSVIWKCLCDCGNETEIAAYYLIRGDIKSCGCLGIENSKKNMQKAVKYHLEHHIVEGTNLQVIEREEVLSNNTSGHTGVKWDKDRQKWCAEIKFKSKRYYLGRYTNKEDAIKVRQEAEDRLHKKFLEWYYSKGR